MNGLKEPYNPQEWMHARPYDPDVLEDVDDLERIGAKSRVVRVRMHA